LSTASAVAGELRRAADSAGEDIVVDDSLGTTGSIGWTTADKASTDLYGAHLDLTVDQMLDGVSQGTTTFSENISATGTTLTDWEGCGLNIIYNNVAAGGTQTFTIDGFEEQYESATINPAASSNYSTSITVYDSLGQSHVVTVYFRKSHETDTPTQTSVWEWHAYLSADDAASGVADSAQSGYLTFGNNGTLITGGNPISVSFDFSQNAQPAQNIDIVFGSGSGGGTQPSTYCLDNELPDTGRLPPRRSDERYRQPGRRNIRSLLERSDT